MSRHAAAVRHAGIESVGLDNVTYARGGRVVLDAVTMTAAAGEVLAVTGPSGSGKSSLLALLAGLDAPDTGTVLIDAQPATGRTRKNFGVVLQGYGLVATLTAAENVEVVLQVAGLPRPAVRERAAHALASLDLDTLGPHLVEELSGGQQQRVAIARALVARPAVLLADELTAELDSATQLRVLNLVFDLADTGAVVVLATHDPAIAGLATHEIHLSDGTAQHTR